MAASLAARTKGAVAQYQLKGTNSSASITPYDSGTILGNVPPGGTGEKLVSGVIQRAADLTVDGTVAGGNALNPTSGTSLVPTPPTGSTAADGLSLAPQHE